MRIHVLTSIADGVSDDPEVFVNDEAAAVLRYNTLLRELGFDGNSDDNDDINDFLSDLEEDELHLYEYDIPIQLSAETLEMFDQIRLIAKVINDPAADKALAEIREALQ